MTLSLKNNLLSVHLYISLVKNNEIKLREFVDTDTTMNIGNKSYHQLIISQYHSIVEIYLEQDPGTDYDVVQLLVIVELKGTYQNVDHGNMIEVIKYKTPYFINKSYPLPFSPFFALGNDVTLHSVLNILNRLNIGSVFDLAKRKFI